MSRCHNCIVRVRFHLLENYHPDYHLDRVPSIHLYSTVLFSAPMKELTTVEILNERELQLMKVSSALSNESTCIPTRYLHARCNKGTRMSDASEIQVIMEVLASDKGISFGIEYVSTYLPRNAIMTSRRSSSRATYPWISPTMLVNCFQEILNYESS